MWLLENFKFYTWLIFLSNSADLGETLRVKSGGGIQHLFAFLGTCVLSDTHQNVPLTFSGIGALRLLRNCLIASKNSPQSLPK